MLKTLISLFLNIINIFFPNNIINITTLLFSLYYVSTNIMSWPLSFQRRSTPASWTTYVVIIKIIKIFFLKISLNITKNIIRNFKHYQNTQTVLLNLSQLAKEWAYNCITYICIKNLKDNLQPHYLVLMFETYLYSI